MFANDDEPQNSNNEFPHNTFKKSQPEVNQKAVRSQSEVVKKHVLQNTENGNRTRRKEYFPQKRKKEVKERKKSPLATVL